MPREQTIVFRALVQQFAFMPCLGGQVEGEDLILPPPSADGGAGWLGEPGLSLCIPSVSLHLFPHWLKPVDVNKDVYFPWKLLTWKLV